jgi:hypothetical protein
LIWHKHGPEVGIYLEVPAGRLQGSGGPHFGQLFTKLTMNQRFSNLVSESTISNLRAMGVWGGVATGSFMLYLSPPCPTFLQTAGGPPLKRPYGRLRGGPLRAGRLRPSTLLDTPRRTPMLRANLLAFGPGLRPIDPNKAAGR